MNFKRSWGVLLDTEKHSPSLGRDDSSASTAWRPFCTCGWSGIAIFSSVDTKDLQEVFQKFTEEHGIDSILPSDAIFGSSNDALIQVMQHIGYNPEEDTRSTIEDLESSVSLLKDYDVKSSFSEELDDLISRFPHIVESVADAKYRSFVWRTTETPVLRENAAETELLLRQHLIKRWESKKSTSNNV